MPKENLLGTEGAGFKQAMTTLDGGRIGIGAMALGLGRAALDASIKYALERQSFGKPIAEFQAVQLKIARMYTHLKNVENIIYRTAWMQKNGIRDISFINASKAYTSMAGVEVTNDAIQIFGGYGYMHEYPVEKMYRDAKLMEIGAGTTDINMLTCARSELDLL